MRSDSAPLKKFYPAQAAQIIDKLGPPPAFFRRLSIADKMLVGFLILVVLTLVTAGYALSSLHRINSLNNSILKVDVVVQESSDKMLDSLLAMDAYEKRFLVLGTDDMANLFQRRKREFDQWFDRVGRLPRQDAAAIRRIGELAAAYETLFLQEVQLVHAQRPERARAMSSGRTKEVVDELTRRLRAQTAAAGASQDVRMAEVADVGRVAFLTSIGLCVAGVLIGMIAALLVTHYVSSSVSRLTDATLHFAEGDFDYDPQISTGDEIGVLSRAFLDMGRRLAKLEELSLDASPLTRLPGGVAVETALQRRIESGHPLACCWIDLANFKAFNDRYGYAKGNDVLKETATIVESAVRAIGTPEDFVGHIGGDDFVVITVPDMMKNIACQIIEQFDRKAPEFYEPDDRERGYIAGVTRQGAKIRFPIMTISIAIVTNERKRLAGLPEVSALAAELKTRAKMDTRSAYVIDRRGRS